jgi:hypothetical protein
VVFITHPWLIVLFTRRPQFGANSTRQAEQYVDAMANLSLEPPEIWPLAGTINDYVLGHSLRAVSMAESSELQASIPQSDIAEIPELAPLPAYLRSRALVERFEFGLETVLDGIEKRVQHRS